MAKTKLKYKKINFMIEKSVEKAFNKGFKSVLDDISYRIGVLADTQANKMNKLSKVTSQMLNIPSHILDGYVFTDNSPSAGYVAWSDCHVTYKGTTVDITSASTNKKYIWWDYSAAPNTAFQVSDTMPALTDDDCLIAINESGMHSMNIGDGRATHGEAILSGTVTGAQVAEGSLTGNHLSSVANILGSQLSSTAGITGAQLSSTAGITGSQLSASAGIAGSQLSASAGITGTQLSASANIQGTQIKSNTITSTQISTTAGILGSQLASNAGIAGGQIASNAGITGGQIATNAGITGSQLAANANIQGAQIGAGAIASNNLNLAAHLLS